MPRPALRIAAIVAGILLVASQALAGALLPGPETYTMPADFGMSASVTTRVLSLGGEISCVNDSSFVNPAFAAAQLRPSAGLRGTTTKFTAGPDITSKAANLTYPTNPNETGFEAQILDVDTHDGTIMLPGLGPTRFELSEDAWIVDYGRRIKPKLLVGLSILGFERLEFSMHSGPMTLAQYVGRADYGGQGGVAYEYEPGDFIGAMYSFTQHTVHCTGMYVQPSFDVVFHARQWALGVTKHVNPKVLLAAEWQRGQLKNGLVDNTSDSWHFGAEYQATPQWAFRAGLNDGDFSAGVGYGTGRWRIDYAYIKNWNGGDAGQLFGGSNTNSLQAIYQW